MIDSGSSQGFGDGIGLAMGSRPHQQRPFMPIGSFDRPGRGPMVAMSVPFRAGPVLGIVADGVKFPIAGRCPIPGGNIRQSGRTLAQGGTGDQCAGG
jgi:hypothetical protein